MWGVNKHKMIKIILLCHLFLLFCFLFFEMGSM